MRRKHTYGLAFLAVLVAAAAGFLLARRMIGPVELPQVDAVAQAQALLGDIDINSLIPRRTPSARPTSSQSGARTPLAGQVIVEPLATSAPAGGDTGGTPGPAAQPESTASPAVEPVGVDAKETLLATPTVAAQAPTPTPAPLDAGALFVSAGPVRHGNADCPGASIRGVVRDAGGAALSGVRLWRYDQWGNEQVVETKGAESDLGQYDFPLGDTPNTHYVQVVDSSGVIISPVIEIQHRQGEAPDAACHWLDWVRR